MAKHISPQNFLSGEWYLYKDGIVHSSTFFVYEASVFKYWQGGFCQLDSKYYQSNKLFNFKSKIVKYTDCQIELTLSLVGVPPEFIKQEKLEVYKPNKKNKKCKKNL